MGGEESLERLLGILGSSLDVEVPLLRHSLSRGGRRRQRLTDGEAASQASEEAVGVPGLHQFGVADPRLEFRESLLDRLLVVFVDLHIAEVESGRVDAHHRLDHPEHLVAGHLEIDPLRRASLILGDVLLQFPLGRRDHSRRRFLARLEPHEHHDEGGQARVPPANHEAGTDVSPEGGREVFLAEVVSAEGFVEVLEFARRPVRAELVQQELPESLQPRFGHRHRAELRPIADRLEKLSRLRHVEQHGGFLREAFPAGPQIAGDRGGGSEQEDDGREPAGAEAHDESFRNGEIVGRWSRLARYGDAFAPSAAGPSA